jgi:hypothetical protein
VLKGRGEFIEAGEALSAYWDEGIDSNIEDARGLAQTKLRNGSVHSSGNRQASEYAGEQKKRADRSARLMMCLAESAREYAGEF